MKAGLSAAAAAKLILAAGIKCRRGTLLAWERGNAPTCREPFASDLPIIAGVYGCDVSDFFVPSDCESEVSVANGRHTMS